MTVRRFIGSVALLLLAACETPSEVRELAIETSAAALQLSDQLQRNAVAGKELQAARVASIDTISQDTLNVRLEVEGRLAAAKAVAHPAAADFAKVREFITAQQMFIAKANVERSKAVETVSNSLDAVSPPIEQLRNVASDMIVLGRKEDTWARLKQTGGFVKDVAERIREAQKAAEEEAE